MDWWTGFWTWVNDNQLAATVIGGLILAAIIWAFARLPKIGPHVRIVLKWIWSWRPVSARRHDRVTAKLTQELIASNLARKELAIKTDEALDQIRGSLPNVALVLSEQLAEEKQRVDTIMNAVEDLTRTQQALTDKIEAIVVAPEAQNPPDVPWSASSEPVSPPAPAPRWRLTAPSRRLDQNQEDGKYLLQNLIDGSIARNVRMDNDGVGTFDFEDAAFWPDLSGKKTAAFAGDIIEADTQGDVRLRLTYLDEYNRTRTVLYWVNQDGRVREITLDDDTPF